MTEGNDNLDFERRVSERLRAAAADVSPAEAARLANARRAAIEALEKPARNIAAWLPLGAAVTALIAVAAVMLMRDPADTTPLSAEAGEDVEILMAGEDLELIEDLEFYLWLAASDETG